MKQQDVQVEWQMKGQDLDMESMVSALQMEWMVKMDHVGEYMVWEDLKVEQV